MGSGHVEVSALPGDSTLASGLAKKTGAGLLAYLSHAPGIPSSHEVSKPLSCSKYFGHPLALKASRRLTKLMDATPCQLAHAGQGVGHV